MKSLYGYRKAERELGALPERVTARGTPRKLCWENHIRGRPQQHSW